MKKKIGFVIIGRLKSKRLPNKLLKKNRKKSVLEHSIDRAKKIKIIKNIILCTSKLKQDDKITQIAKKKKLMYIEVIK